MWSPSLLATLFANTRDDPMQRPEIIWGTLGLTLVLLVGAGVIYAVDKWRKRTAEQKHDATESLTSFRAMYEAGEITEAEYTELKRRLAEKVKKPSAASSPPPPPPPEPTEPSPPPSTA